MRHNNGQTTNNQHVSTCLPPPLPIANQCQSGFANNGAEQRRRERKGGNVEASSVVSCVCAGFPKDVGGVYLAKPWALASLLLSQERHLRHPSPAGRFAQEVAHQLSAFQVSAPALCRPPEPSRGLCHCDDALDRPCVRGWGPQQQTNCQNYVVLVHATNKLR